MAVRLADYYRGHLRRIIYVCAAIILINGGLLFAALWLTHILPVVVTYEIVALALLLQICAVMIALRYALEPLEIITRAITHVSSQANNVTPPLMGATRHQRSGLASMVQTIYSRQLTALQSASGETTDAPQSLQIADIVPCGIIGLDRGKNIVYANSRAPVITNSRGIQLVTLRFDPNNSLATWLDYAVEHKVNSEKIWERVADNIPDRPETRLYDVIAYYEKDAADGIETRIVTIDRTAAYTTDQDAVDFISVAAHELRGPITVIRGYLDVLVDELSSVLKDDQKELVERLDVSASRLSGYINNILNVAKYDRQHLKLHLQEDRFKDVYSTIADDLQLRARTQRRILAVTIPHDLPTIAADRNSLTEVIANLVDNAIKYSNEGGQVDVTVETDGNYVRCSVHDNGIGIPSSVIANLFTKFYRSHRSRSSVAGTGLGLYISKAIVESHGGQIGVSSKDGEGATFYFTIPIYSTVADTLAASNNGNEGIIESSSGWIRNHSKIGG